MLHNGHLKTIRWQYVRNIELPRAVHVKVKQLAEKNNYYAQITVRFHSQQLLAIYDRFGRLMYGSEAVLKDVLEYVVFEQHLNYHYGSWRLHAKIVPDWLPSKTPVTRTFRKPSFTSESEEERLEREKKIAQADADDVEEKGSGGETVIEPKKNMFHTGSSFLTRMRQKLHMP